MAIPHVWDFYTAWPQKETPRPSSTIRRFRSINTHKTFLLPITLFKALEHQYNGKVHKMTPFWKANTPTYILWGIMGRLNISFFSTGFWKMWEKNENFFFFYTKLSIYRIFLTHSMYTAKMTPQNTFCHSSWVWQYHMCETFSQPSHIEGPNIQGAPSCVLGT